MAKRSWVHLGAKLLGVTLSVVMLISYSSLSADADEPVKIIGFMDSNSQSPWDRMLVDPGLNLGVTIGNAGVSIILYDLEALQSISIAPEKARVPPGLRGITADRASVDEANHRVFFAPGNVTDFTLSSNCATGPDPRFSIGAFDLVSHKWSTVPVECAPYAGVSGGSSADQFKVTGVYYHAGSDRLYATGQDQNGWALRNATFGLKTYNRTETSSLLRQIEPENGTVEWELDLKQAGCDRIVNLIGLREDVGSFIARVGKSLYSYCYGARTGLQGDQGFAVKIPLDQSGHYTVANGKPVVKLTPTLPNDVFPILDPVSGSVLLLTSGPPNGDAVWVFDPEAERFAGVIASGISAISNQSWTAAGLDLLTGRTYMLSNAGLLVADARHRPLPSGLNFKLGLTAERSGQMIAVAPKLRRLFMPVRDVKGEKNTYVVIEDRLQRPADLPKRDPDGGTANIPEVEGKTISSYSGSAGGFGARILVTGGITRAINNLDYACYNDNLEQLLRAQLGRPVLKDAQGRCLADQVLTGGARDLYLAPTQLDLGSQTGAVAYAAGAAFSTADTASDRDLKRIGSCFVDMFEDRGLQRPPENYGTLCNSIPVIGDFQAGTRGTDGKGAPIPNSSCADFGDEPDSAQQPSTPVYASLVGSSNVECNMQERSVTATASASVFSYPSVASPMVSIGRAWTITSSKVTDSGTLTTIESVATGVKIGQYSIGRLTTVAATKAHGREGTTDVDFVRMISDVHGPNIDCYICNYDQVIAAMNQGLGLRMRVSQPQEQILESRLGYHSYVVKDEAARESDRATNNDDTFSVPALQIIFYNDGHDGRNRFILQLAGIQAESRYGIIPLPELGQPTIEIPTQFDTLDELVTSSGPVVLGGQAAKAPVVAVRDILRAPAQFVDDAVRLVIHNPREFALLFILWSLLAAPIYLGLRRRSLLREVRS